MRVLQDRVSCFELTGGDSIFAVDLNETQCIEIPLVSLKKSL